MSTPHKGPPRILFSSTLFTPFIEQDEILLASKYQVDRVIARGIVALMRIPSAVARADITLSWFGSVYAGFTVLLARMFGKKSIIVVAGVDASKDKEINYGIWLSRWKSVIVRYAFRHADRLLTVDGFLQKEVIRLAEYDGANIVNIPFGFDAEEWKPSGNIETMVLTVAACHDKWRMKKKGIDKLFDAAQSLNNMRFCVIGIHESLLPEVSRYAPKNVELIPYVPRNQLLQHYQRAKVYCQPSYTEGLPNTLCEAMLCGCIPVGTIVGGIPTAIGDAGYLVPYSDQPALVGALQSALAASPTDGQKARGRIAKMFTLQKRQQALERIIEELCR